MKHLSPGTDFRFPETPDFIPKNIVIFLHGYGSNGLDLLSIGRVWQQAMPNIVFHAPNAPQDFENAPGQGGYQWYGLNHHAMIDFNDLAYDHRSWFDDYCRDLCARYDLTRDKVILVGFSQGTAMAFAAGLTAKESFAGILAYSGGFLKNTRIKKEDIANQNLPVFLVHGDRDDVVPPAALTMSKTSLGTLGIDASTHLCKGVAHSINQEGLEIGQKFILSLI